MAESSLQSIRERMRSDTLAAEAAPLRRLIAEARLSAEDRERISAQAAETVDRIHNSGKPGMMGLFLCEYGLGTEEGLALMRLSEALLRTPDPHTIGALLADKLVSENWAGHLGHSSSTLVNAATRALQLCDRVLSDRNSVLGRLGSPAVRMAVTAAMKRLGRQFVLGQDMAEAMQQARSMEAKGYTYSYDMLGEAARTEADAARYHRDYSDAIAALAPHCTSGNFRANPGVSIKLSALHSRYEQAQRGCLMTELVERVRSLAIAAKEANMGLNIDAEEAERLDLSLDLIEAVLGDPQLAGWDGFGMVVQAYGLRAGHVIDWLYALAGRLDRRIMLRLVKGAYWDLEIKRAQVLGLDGFPVFTRKPSTDVSYIACVRKLAGMSDRIYAQFAGHNAHTVAAVLDIVPDRDSFEFQRLQGMGEELHEFVRRGEKTRCRIYAPVGLHRDLLPYLMRRLLENGANSSFVNQIADPHVTAAAIAADPFAAVEGYLDSPRNRVISALADLFGSERRNAKGWDLTSVTDLAGIERQRGPFRTKTFAAAPLLVCSAGQGATVKIRNPAIPDDLVGECTCATPEAVPEAVGAAQPWEASLTERARVLRRAADLYEDNAGLFFALAAREAGKTQPDAVGELREAVDFLRHYATEAVSVTKPARGVIACISPWNFPLAIFTGQIAAALAAGNAVLAKPAEQTPLIAHEAVRLLHQAGVPSDALQFLPGEGETVGMALASHPKIDGICFTGSTLTAQSINRAMAEHMRADAVLVAETGGLNAMIVDATALPEQAVRDILASAFQSAGQRCSSLRCLYVQEDIAAPLSAMLFGAMDQLRHADPWDAATDVGPVIDAAAAARITAHIEQACAEGRVLKTADVPAGGLFMPPTAIRVNGVQDLGEEIFGPVLHIATFKAGEIDRVVAEVNASGYGLTFGLHTRIDARVRDVIGKIRVGNAYVNRNQIGAVVGSQPFGGEGLSGTGPKAGGTEMLGRLTAFERPLIAPQPAEAASVDAVQEKLNGLALPDAQPRARDMPGPTGEANLLSSFGCGRVLCLGPSREAADRQAAEARAAGCAALTVCAGGDADGTLAPQALKGLSGFDAVIYWGPEDEACAYRCALAERPGELVPLVCASGDPARLKIERHVCIDTTASGGNAALLADAAEQ